MVSFTSLLTNALLASSALAVPYHSHNSHHTVQKRSTSKRGSAYNDATLAASLSSSANGKISWAYNWNPESFGLSASGVEYVPMLWGTKFFGQWATALETFFASASGVNYIMGFNEPDNSQQSALTPEVATTYYQQYITPYSGKAKLVSPGVSSSEESGQGLSWLNSFLQQCSSCDISVLAVHWYGDNIDQFETYITQAVNLAAKYGKSEVWVTEFGLASDQSSIANPSQTLAFMQQAITFLDSQANVTRYAYFYTADGFLMTGNSINELGSAYIA